MKLVIQIPCFNEQDSLETTLRALPRELPGFDHIEWLVINDGSTDKTAEIARANGVDHVVELSRNQGLAKAFMAGINESLSVGADIIVNTDADNQYCADDIPKLVEPILRGQAEFVIGARPIETTVHFSRIKKLLQKLGSGVVRAVSGTSIPDAPSGFRAMSCECAKQLNVYNEYTYTLETIIQAGHKNMAITSVPIRTNPEMRESRLLSSIPSYVWKSILTIIRILVVYQPFKFFMSIAVFLSSLGFLIGLRFLYFYINGEGSGHVQSVVLSGTLIVIGFQTALMAFMADLLSVNRKLLEDLRIRQRNTKDKP